MIEATARSELLQLARRKPLGARYVADVHGSKQAKIIEREHDRLSTYALLSQEPTTIVDYLDQLASLGFLERDPTHFTLRHEVEASSRLSSSVPEVA